MSDSNGFEISVKEYAEQRNKTVQAVYQQMKRKENAVALKGHIILRRKGNKQVKFLDEEAVAILDSASNATPVVFVQDTLKDDLDKAKQEADAWKLEAAKREGMIALLKEQLADKDNQLKALAEPQSQINALEAKNADLSAERDSARERAAQAEKTAQAATDELTAIKSKWFYKWFAKKE